MLELYNYLKAGVPIIWLRTGDYKHALNYIHQAVKQAVYRVPNGDSTKAVCKKVKFWSVADGLSGNAADKLSAQPAPAIQPLIAMQDELANNRSDSLVFVLFDFHKFIGQPHIWRAMINLTDKMAATNSNIVIVSPEVTIPPEMENYVTVVPFPLPDKDTLLGLAKKIFEDNNINTADLDFDAITNYGLGLTRTVFINSLYLLISSAPVTTANACSIIKAQKENMLAQTELLRPLESDRDFTSLVGLDVMKNFTKRMIAGGNGRGILILGVPGGGKTAFCSCLGNETGRPVLQMDFSRLMGGIVGETESKTAKALEMVDAMQPAILFVDEIEKGLAGTSGGNGDSGTSKRQGGQFLRWLSDHKSDIYIVATANDISALPSEFLRAERWDTIFFVDVPDEDQGVALFNLYRTQYGLSEDNSCSYADIKEWTGAEIKSLCRIAAGTGITLKQATSMIVPMCRVANDRLEALRRHASQFAIPANAPKTSDDVEHNGREVFGVRRV